MKTPLRLALVGDYHPDIVAHQAIPLAIDDAAAVLEQPVKYDWLATPSIVSGEALAEYDAVWVVPGSPYRHPQGAFTAIRYARENKVPFFGICLGMQCAVIEFARHVAGLTKANSEEFDPLTDEKVIYLMTEWYDFRKNSVEVRDEASNKGGTLRLGAYPCTLLPGTKAAEAYKQENISERHRHRYEFNNAFRETLSQHGMVFSGTSPDGTLVEIVELPDHPWFVGCQFHPEFKSRPMRAHPLFHDFIAAAVKQSRKR